MPAPIALGCIQTLFGIQALNLNVFWFLQFCRPKYYELLWACWPVSCSFFSCLNVCLCIKVHIHMSIYTHIWIYRYMYIHVYTYTKKVLLLPEQYAGIKGLGLIFRQSKNKAENGSDYPSITLSTVFLTNPWCTHFFFPSLTSIWRKICFTGHASRCEISFFVIWSLRPGISYTWGRLSMLIVWGRVSSIRKVP